MVLRPRALMPRGIQRSLPCLLFPLLAITALVVLHRRQLSGLQHPGEGAAHIFSEEIDEPCTNEALAEERPQPIENRFALPRGLSRSWEEAAGTVAGNEPVTRGLRARCREGIRIKGLVNSRSVGRGRSECVRSASNVR